MAIRPETSVPVIDVKTDKRNTIALTTDGAFFSLGSAFVEGNTILPTFVSTLTGSSLLVGLISTIRTMGFFLPQIFVAAHIEKKVRKKPFMMKAAGLMRLGLLGMAMSSLMAQSQPRFTLVLFYVFVALMAFSDGCGALPWIDIVAKTVPAKRRGRLFGSIQALGGISAFLAGFFIRWILSAGFSYPINFVVLMILAFVAQLISWLAMYMIVEPDGKTDLAAGTIFQYLKSVPNTLTGHRLFKQVILVRVLCGGIYLVIPFFALHAMEQLGFSTGTVGYFISAQMLGSVIGGPLWGQLGDRQGSCRVIRYVSIVTMLTGIFALAARYAFSFGMIWMTYGLYFGLYFFLGMAFGGAWIGFSNYVLDIAPEDKRATYIGILNTITAPLTLLSLIGGWVLTFSDYVCLFRAEVLILVAGCYLAWNLPDSRDWN